MVRPPEPATAELIVRATHVEAPSQDGSTDGVTGEPPAAGEIAAERGSSRPADAEPDDEREQEVSGRERRSRGQPAPMPGSLTPQGRLRDAVTEDPGFVWELPDAARLLTRSTGEQARPDTAGQGRIASEPRRGAGALRRRGEGDRHGRWAAHHAL